MIIKHKNAVVTSGLAMGIGVGIGISLLVTLILTAIAALLMSRESLAEDSIDIIVIAVELISSLAGAWTAYTLIKSRRLLVCLGTVAGYYLLMLGCTALFFDGQYQGVGISALAVLVGGLVVGLLGLKEKKQSRVNRKIIKNR